MRISLRDNYNIYFSLFPSSFHESLLVYPRPCSFGNLSLQSNIRLRSLRKRSYPLIHKKHCTGTAVAASAALTAGSAVIATLPLLAGCFAFIFSTWYLETIPTELGPRQINIPSSFADQLFLWDCLQLSRNALLAHSHFLDLMNLTNRDLFSGYFPGLEANFDLMLYVENRINERIAGGFNIDALVHEYDLRIQQLEPILSQTPPFVNNYIIGYSANPVGFSINCMMRFVVLIEYGGFDLI